MKRAHSLRAAVARLRLLPVFLIVAGAALAFKAGHFAGDVSRFITVAQAQEEQAADAAKSAQEAQGPVVEPVERARTGPVSQSEMSLLEDLRQRRRQLEEREKKAALREQLLASTERRIDRKLDELKAIEGHVQELVETHKVREESQLTSIVKVYESMKPKDAAPIFQRLDLAIQTAVATRMKETKMAAMLAEMDPDSAKVLTTHLATRNQLPDVSEIVAESESP